LTHEGELNHKDNIAFYITFVEQYKLSTLLHILHLLQPLHPVFLSSSSSSSSRSLSGTGSMEFLPGTQYLESYAVEGHPAAGNVQATLVWLDESTHQLVPIVLLVNLSSGQGGREMLGPEEGGGSMKPKMV
jgi:hypothetical protein